MVRSTSFFSPQIPNAKRLETALTYVYGIGPTTAKAIVRDTEMPNMRVKDMTEDQLNTVRAEVDKYMTEGDLRRFNALNIKRLIEVSEPTARPPVAAPPQPPPGPLLLHSSTLCHRL